MCWSFSGLVNPNRVIVSANTTTNLDIWKKRGCRVTQKNGNVQNS